MPLPAVLEDVDPSLHDPEILTLLVVQQWLEESGYHEALRALEKQTGLLYDDSKLKQGSKLMHIMWKQIEQEITTEVDEEEFSKQEEEEHLLRGGEGDYACAQVESVEGVHPSNITCVRVLPSGAAFVSGSGDGYVRCASFKGEVAWSSKVGSGGVLCIDLHTGSSGATRVLAGSMDGSLTVLDASSGNTVCNLTGGHSKYVVGAIWAPNGATLATCSYDQYVGIHTLEDTDGVWSIRTVKKVPYLAAVQALCFLADGHTLAVGVKGSNLIKLLNTESLQEPELSINTNEHGDHHVSFCIQHMVLSPCGSYLLASTDTSRVLMLRTRDWSQVRNFYGVPVAQFHNPCAAWHRDGMYIYVAGSDAQVHVFHVGTAKVVAKIAGHKINVRDLDYYYNKDSGLALLVSCSFDKTVKVFAPKA